MEREDFNITYKWQLKNPRPVICPACDNIFETKYRWQKYCSYTCRKANARKKEIQDNKKERRCKYLNCNTILSIYNRDRYCFIHQRKILEDEAREDRKKELAKVKKAGQYKKRR